MLLRVTNIAVICIAVVACGGSSNVVIGDGGTGDDGGANDAGTCEQLLSDIDNLRYQAIACCDTCKSLQCTQTVDDLCCPLSVNDRNGRAVVQFEKSLQAFRGAHCQKPECPARPCHIGPSLMCSPSVSGSDPTGRCAQ